MDREEPHLSSIKVRQPASSGSPTLIVTAQASTRER